MTISVAEATRDIGEKTIGAMNIALISASDIILYEGVEVQVIVMTLPTLN